LDIGDQAYHFPSPPDLDKSMGGFSMCLSDLGPRQRPALVSEYIHPSRAFRFQDWSRAGRWVGFSPEENLDPDLYRSQQL